MTPPEPVEARDLTAEDIELGARLQDALDALSLAILHEHGHVQLGESWYRKARSGIVGVEQAALRADTARVPEGLDVKRIALAIMAADLFESDGIPPGRWDLYAESIAKRIVVGDARARAALATSPEGGSDE